ncbi:MAG: HEAT repeat domain-containing protein [Cyclobacteriaceae bacterium]|nr:HEAT repeat domain-containing protein [Cyclobacteriaceae bacterium HetDA_MAG_MS6]
MDAISDEQLISFLEGDLDDIQRQQVEQLIHQDDRLQQRLEQLRSLLGHFEQATEYDPPADLKWSFQAMLESERPTVKPLIPKSWLQIAAAVILLVTGYLAGRGGSQTSSDDLLSLKAEVKNLQKAVMMTTLEDHSASDRIQAVGRIERLPTASDPKLIQALLKSLNTDKSPNVRYAVVQALSRFTGEESVRLALVSSLGKQADPLIQIAMINLLVEAEEKAVLTPLRNMIKDDQLTPEVKRQAEIAMEILI